MQLWKDIWDVKCQDCGRTTPGTIIRLRMWHTVGELKTVVCSVCCRSLTTPEMLKMLCMSSMAKSCAMKGRDFHCSSKFLSDKNFFFLKQNIFFFAVSGWPLSTPVFVCVAAVAEVVAVEEDVSLIAMAEVPRTVGGKLVTPLFRLDIKSLTCSSMEDFYSLLSFKWGKNRY